MAGATYQVGEQKVRPGVYVRVTSAGAPQEAVVPQGTVATLVQASWGPLNDVVAIENATGIGATYGAAKSGDTTAMIGEALAGGALRVLACRIGTGGAKAALTLDDTDSPTSVVTLTARYEGTRGSDLNVTIRDSLSDNNARELLIFEGATLRQTVVFAKGSGDDGEPAALVAAVTASNSLWVTAVKLADGNKIMAATTNSTLTSGANPSVSGSEYSAGLTALEPLDWNVLAVDTNDTSVHASVQTYVDRIRGDGKRVIGVLGEKTSETLNDRLTHAAAFNDPAIVYVANGFVGADDVVREGYLAAARVAGMVAAAPITSSLTHAVVAAAADIKGPLTNAEIEQALQSGAIVFTVSARKQIHIEYGITTFITPTADLDAGWRKIRRVKTRDALIDRIAGTWDPLIGKVNNSPDGRATLVAAAQGIINRMIGEGALLSGQFAEDTNNPPVGDSAWFTAQVVDLDSAEHVYIAFGFSFGEVA